jgi:hypothetical protein
MRSFRFLNAGNHLYQELQFVEDICYEGTHMTLRCVSENLCARLVVPLCPMC